MAIDLNSTSNIHRFDFPSNRLSISSEYGNRNADEGDHSRFQDTVPLGSPVEETQLCNLDFNPELSYDSDRGGDEKTTEPPCGYEEMVLDSEDEEINGSRLVAVTKSLPDSEAEKRSEKSCAGREILLTSFGDEKGLHEKPTCEGELVRLNGTSTWELEEWSQAEALGFVDHFVLTNKFDMSQGADYRKTCKEKSPIVPSVRGPQNLARRINQQTHMKEKWKFEFIDNDPHEGLDSFGKKITFTSHQAEIGTDDRGYSSLGDKDTDKNGISILHMQTRNLSDLDKGFAGRSSKYGNEMARVYEANALANSSKELELAGNKSEASDMGSEALQIYDIGFNTQIAAEAIEALAYGHTFDYGSTNACQDGEKILDGSLGGAMENNAQLKPPYVQTSACYDRGDILGYVKRKKRSNRKFGRDMSSLSAKQYGREEVDPESTRPKLVKRSKMFAETKLSGSNSSNSNESSDRNSPKQIKQSAKGVLEKNNDLILATLIQNTTLGNEQSEGSTFSCRTRQQDTGVRLNKSEARASTLGEKVNNNIDHGVLVYRRKRSRLNANPLKVLSVSGKSSGLCYLSKGARKSILHASSKSDIWNCPKGQRTSRKVGKDSNRTIDLNVPLNSHELERKIRKANMKAKAKSTLCTRPCVPEHSSRNDFPRSLSWTSSGKPDSVVSVTAATGSECITSVAVGTEKDRTLIASSNDALEPSGSECTTISSRTGKNVVPSNTVYNYHHKIPCNKNVPKASLLKELINLGVPEKIPEVARKELRRRRDMAHVRILFSQHLDDDIVKQQKKVAARLGTSIVSCSMDATHFIADKFARTKNMLEAIALGKPVVTHQWLESCGQANCFIDENTYILRDAKKEKEFGFSMPVSLARANQHPLLKDQRVFVTPNIKPEKEMITNLVKAVRGQPVEKLQTSALKDENIAEGLLILSCKEDHSICLPFLKKGSAVYSSELLLHGIVTQKLEYKRHQLFANDVKRYCS